MQGFLSWWYSMQIRSRTMVIGPILKPIWIMIIGIIVHARSKGIIRSLSAHLEYVSAQKKWIQVMECLNWFPRSIPLQVVKIHFKAKIDSLSLPEPMKHISNLPSLEGRIFNQKIPWLYGDASCKWENRCEARPGN